MNQTTKGKGPNHHLHIDRVHSERDVFIIQTVENMNFARSSRGPTTPEAPDPFIFEHDHNPAITLAALAYLRQPGTCIYLGERYGRSPHSKIATELLSGLGALPANSTNATSCSAISWLASRKNFNRQKAMLHLAAKFSSLDQINPKIEEELTSLSALVAGRQLVTGAYSSRIKSSLKATAIEDDGQLLDHDFGDHSERAILFMLHGSEQNFDNALIAEVEVQNFPWKRPLIALQVSKLLTSPWIVLGANSEGDSTFWQLIHRYYQPSGQEHPIFSIDNAPNEDFRKYWPNRRFHQVHLEAAEFLSLGLVKTNFEPQPTLSSSEWYRRRCSVCLHTFRLGDLAIHCATCMKRYHWNPALDLDCLGNQCHSNNGQCACGAKLQKPPNLPPYAHNSPSTSAVQISSWPKFITITPRIEGRLCAVCGHTLRQHEMVASCPCGNGPGGLCPGLIHEDNASGLRCWDAWIHGKSFSRCPLSGQQFLIRGESNV